MVAERVRDLAEAVEGEDQEREGPLGADGLGEGPAEPVLEHHPVGQPRDLVEEAHLAQRLLGQPLLRDVEDEAAHEAGLPVGVRQHPPLVAPPHDTPVAVEDAVLGGEAPPEAQASRNWRSTRSRSSGCSRLTHMSGSASHSPGVKPVIAWSCGLT